MNKMIALMLAASASALLAATPAHAQDASYKSLTDKATADYKQAKAACDAHSGNAKKVCVEEASVARQGRIGRRGAIPQYAARTGQGPQGCRQCRV